MPFFSGGVAELLGELVAEFLSARILVARAGHEVFDSPIVGQDIPVFVSEVDPPVLCIPFEEGGGEDNHQRWNSSVDVLEGFKIRLAIPEEPGDIVVIPFEWKGWLHQDGLDPEHRGG